MKARRTYATLIATLLAVGSVGSTPSLARDSRYLKVAYSAVLNGKEIPAGEYRVSWKTHSPEACVGFRRRRCKRADEAAASWEKDQRCGCSSAPTLRGFRSTG